MFNLLEYNFDNKYNVLTLYLLFTTIVLFNILTLSSVANIILTIPQYTVVLYLLFKKNISASVLLHFTFVILSLSAQRTLGMFEGKEFSMYNYGTIKLIGPIRACYAMNVLYFSILLKSKFMFHKEYLFYRLYKVMLYLGISAGALGFMGLLFHPYYSFEGFMDCCIYMFVVLTSMFILLKVATLKYIRAIFNICIISMLASSFACFVAYAFLGIISSYGGLEIAYQADILYMAPILFVGIISIKYRMLLFVSLACYVVVLLSAMEGKTVFSVGFAFIALLYFLFWDKASKQKLGNKIGVIRIVIVLLFVVGSTWVVSNVSENSMAGYKFASAMSMFTGEIDEMGRSPYIRVASTINIINEGLHNPFILLFGNGYGGYFEDKLGLFVGLDLSQGAWHDDVIGTGRFTSGHDTMVTVPLFNGFVGLVVLLRVCVAYIKRMTYNFMNGIAFIWIVLQFYANTLFAYIGICCLIASEYDINSNLGVKSKGVIVNMQNKCPQR